MNHVLAQQIQLPWDGGSAYIDGPLNSLTFGGAGNMTIGGIISRATTYIFIFAGIGLLLMLIFGGFNLLTSAGDAKKLEMGKQRLTNAVVGFVIIFAAFWIVQALGIIFNLEPITNVFG